MKKLTALLVAMLLVLTACTSDSEVSADMSMDEMGTMLSDMSVDAEGLMSELEGNDAAAQVRQILDVIVANTATVAASATGGEVSDDDLGDLQNSLGDFTDEIDAVRDQLDDSVVEDLEGYRDQLTDLVDQLTNA